MNCIIVHGCPPVESAMIDIRTNTKEHWIPWVREELKKHSVQVSTPIMPKSWLPNYTMWEKEFDKIPINESSVLVGNSCGAAFLVRWLSNHKNRIKKLILVAPALIPGEEASQVVKDFYNFEINSDLKDRIGQTIIFIGLKDKERHQKSAKLYADTLNGKLVEFPNVGHFMPQDMGTYKFPELLAEVLRQ